jgi:hypothetical protein
MPKTKKSLFLRNLAKFDVLIEDTSALSPYFQVTNLPPKFTGGRNSFLLGTSPLLQPNSKVLIEILDANGRTIYNEVVVGYSDANSKLVLVEVYDTTATGFATIIIMGQARTYENGTPIPEEWQNKYNVRWSYRIVTDYAALNVSPLKFKDRPSAIVEESRFRYAYNPEYIFNEVELPTTLTPWIYASTQRGYRLDSQLPTSFSAEYFGGTYTGSMTINNVGYNVSIPVTSIRNSATAFAYNSLIGIPGNFIQGMLLQSGSYTTSVNNNPAEVTSSVVLRYPVLTQPTSSSPISFANIRVFNLNTVSGEVHKMRIYHRSATDRGEYKIIGDVPIRTEELLSNITDRGSISYGYLNQSPTVDTSWLLGYLTSNPDGQNSFIYPRSGSSEYYLGTGNSTGSLVVDDDTLLRSIHASIPTTGNTFVSPVNSTGYFIGNRNSITVSPNTEYTLEFNVLYKTQSGSVILEGNAPSFDIYIIGDQGTTVITDNPLGQYLGRIAPRSAIELYERLQFNFTPKISSVGDVFLRFVITNGFWYISDISIKPASDARFSPDEVQVYIPNTDYYKQVLEYKLEFFTADNGSSPFFATTIPTFFTGSVVDLGLIPTLP